VAPVPARAAPKPVVNIPRDDALLPEIEMFVGESRVFPSPGVARIAVGNGAILNAAALDGREVILFANAPGTSSLFIWNNRGQHQRLKISIVPGDTARYAREIAAFLQGIPNARTAIIGDKVIVEGDQLSDQELARIEQLAKVYPQIVNFTHSQGMEKMVMLDVKVVEFPVSELRDIGLKWGTTGGMAIGGIWSPIRRGNDGPYQINIQSNPNGPAPITNPSGTGPVPLPAGLNVLSAVNLGLNATLNLLAQQGRTTILAQPQLSARNGAKASFLAGGEIPYAVTSSDGPSVSFKPYGVRLDIQPRVDRHGNVRATVDTEVSNIDPSVTTPFGPALLSRKTSTEFNVQAGETIVLSGLIQRENATNVDKVPGLGDLPVIGALFRSRKFQNKETELVIFVTPSVVDARTPTLVDRVERTEERLGQRLGPPPHLSEPLQPASGAAAPARTVASPPTTPTSAAPSTTPAADGR